MLSSFYVMSPCRWHSSAESSAKSMSSECFDSDHWIPLACPFGNFFHDPVHD